MLKKIEETLNGRTKLAIDLVGLFLSLLIILSAIMKSHYATENSINEIKAQQAIQFENIKDGINRNTVRIERIENLYIRGEGNHAAP